MNHEKQAKETAALLLSARTHNGSHFNELVALGIQEPAARAIALKVAVFRETLERSIAEALPVDVTGMHVGQAITTMVNRGMTYGEAAETARRLGCPAPDDDKPVTMKGGR